MDKPNPDDKWSWGPGDLKIWVPEEGEPLFTPEELERVLEEGRREVEEERKKRERAQQRP